jgi:hypothetical protein
LHRAKSRTEGDILAVRKAVGAGGRAAPGSQAPDSASVEIERPLPRRPVGTVNGAVLSRRTSRPLPLLQVRENPPDDLRVLNAGDDPHLPPAALAAVDVDTG